MYTKRIYDKFYAAYKNGLRAESYGKIFAFKITGTCSWGNLNETWYAYQAGGTYHITAPNGRLTLLPEGHKYTAGGLKGTLAPNPFKVMHMFGRGASIVKRTSWGQFEASGEGCSKISGSIIR